MSNVNVVDAALGNEYPGIVPLPENESVPRVVNAWSLDDWSSLLGAIFASLALVWLLYVQILPTAGKFGFFLLWYLAFVGLYGLITSMSHPRPIVVDRVMAAVIAGGAGFVLLALAWTVGYVLYRGWPAYHHWNFYSSDMTGIAPTDPLTKGGILHALVGSGIELAIAVAISLPLGLGTAVYMTEVGGKLSKVVRTVIEAMTALPDLVAGLFIYAFLIVALGYSRDGLAAALALSITMLPIIARSSEVVLKVVPGGLREASFALGATHWQTVRKVVLPTARPGLATALILGIARGIGETAPVLIVAGVSTFFNANPLKNPMNSLPLFGYEGLRSGEPGFITRGYGAISVLLAVVIVLFIIIRLLARQRVSNR
ncbi:MAG TPA: phosphate ABC transporter permease PstA [Mycobacteriales bacterium]|nr:phosphate ABC transporter permease PstA [Mycobacteriales bacterium]HWC34209.1 phosphate ABC transporter permease PstA [Mycobacteriales bacterium]